MLKRVIRTIFGGREEEQARPGNQPQPEAGSTSPTDKGKLSSGPTIPPSEGATPGTNPTEKGEVTRTERWDSGQRCLVVKTEGLLAPELLETVTINLPEGEIRIVGTNQVQRPILTIEERIFADSEDQAINFYQSNSDGVEVTSGSGSLAVKGKSRPTVVVGGSRGVQISGVSGGVVIFGSNVRGNVVNTGPGGVFIGGQRVGSSGSEPRRETQVVLRVPILEKNANEQEKSGPMYTLEAGSGNIRVENVRGKYTISAGAGDVEIKGCDVVNSLIETGAGDITVTGTFTGVNIIKTRAGDILVRFTRNQGEIEVLTSELVDTIKKTQLFFPGVQNPNGQEKSTLILTTQAGDITVETQQ